MELGWAKHAGAGDGTAVADAYTNWDDGKPNDGADGEDCAVVYLVDGEDGTASGWNDLRCNQQYSFVCEAD